MQKKIVVMSLGGSLIIPNEVNTNFLQEFKKVILKNARNFKFIIVCGGGNIARKYINSLKKINASITMQSLAGIATTRNNARFMNYFFDNEPKKGIPITMQEIKSYLKTKSIVFCGGLSYKKRQTSDSTSAEIAKKFKTNFINITNVDGLYNKDPKKYKNAKLISKISWKDFYKIANKTKFNPGQHFVLDQTASKIILKSKIKTMIIGPNLENLDNLLKEKEFKGTIIKG